MMHDRKLAPSSPENRSFGELMDAITRRVDRCVFVCQEGQREVHYLDERKTCWQKLVCDEGEGEDWDSLVIALAQLLEGTIGLK